MKLRTMVLALAAFASMVFAGCRSKHVEVTVENHTGADVQLLEVDYPSASFGADTLAAGAAMHYRIQLRDSGPIKVQFAIANHTLPQVTGPTVNEEQQGRLEIILLPDGKAEFHPGLNPAQ